MAYRFGLSATALQVVLVCALAQLELRAATFASWTQEASDERKDRYVDVTVDPGLFKIKWTSSLGQGGGYYDRSIATDGKHVYRTTGNFPDSGLLGYRVVALDITNGQMAWQRPIRGYFHPLELGEPAVMNDIVYVNREGHSSHSYEPDHPRLIGINANTGEVVSETLYASQHGTKDRPTVVDGHIVAAGGRYGGLYSFAPSGGIQWFHDVGGDTEVSVVANGKLFRAEGHVLDLSTGQPLPAVVHPEGMRLNFPLVTEDDVLFFSAYHTAANQNDFRVAAFDLATQGHLKDFALPELPYSLAAGNGRIAVRHQEGVRLFDAATGVNYASWHSTDPVINTEMILTRSHLFVHAGESEIHAINLFTGQSEWTFHQEQGGEIALGDGLLIISGINSITAISVVVPEPATCLMSLLGAIAIGARGRITRL